MKVLSLTSVALSLLYLLSSANAITNERDSQNDANSYILSNPKFKPNPLGNIIPGRFIIEFNDNFQGSSTDFVSDMESNIRNMETGISPYIKMSIAQDFTSSPSIFRGVSIALHDGYAASIFKRELDTEINRMQLIENTVLQKLLEENHVKNIYPVTEISRPTVETGATIPSAYTLDDNGSVVLTAQKVDLPADGPPLPFTHVMTQVDKVHSELNLKGKGVTVGIIDSGIDYRHPAFGGGFGPGFPVRFGYDLVGDHFHARDPFSRQVKETPLDACDSGNGHGTHVAGIIAANDHFYNFTGVAPEVTLGAWRVFSCDGTSSNDIIIQALLNAHEAGCDIINLSLGSSSNWANDPSAIVADRVSQKGSLVLSAAGNDGDKGAFYVSSPSTGKYAISISSIDNIFNLQQVFLAETGQSYPYQLSTTTDKFPSGKIVNYSNNSSTADACYGTKPDNDLKGKIVLVQRGTCKFDDKTAVAESFGAVGVLVYDNQKDGIMKAQAAASKIPLSSTSFAAGKELKALLNSKYKGDGLHVEFQTTLTRQNVTSKNEVSVFSSIGPLYDMNLKPDIAGPGGFIFSTLPIANGGYGVLSGTSMSTPYLTGAYALFLQKHGADYNPLYLKEHFQNYAKPSLTMQKYVDNPARQGAGLVQLFDTIEQSVHVSPGSISFNDTTNIQRQTLKILNPSMDAVKYKLKNVQSIALSPYNTILQGYTPLGKPHYEPNTALAELDISPHEILLQPGETAKISISVKNVSRNNDESPYPVYGGYIQFIPEDQEALKTIQVPYVGVKGSLSELPIFDDRFPRIMLNNDTKTFQKQVNDKLITGFVLERSGGHIDSMFRLLTGSAHIQTEVLDFDLNTIGVSAQSYYLSRNTLDPHSYLFTQQWNGTIMTADYNINERTVLEPGLYFLRWKALKLLSDPALTESWETKLSPPISII